MTTMGSPGSGHTNQDLSFPVFLNHFFLVIDSETYAAIEQSPFLRREFAANETRTTERTDITYTGLYFYGVNTYFEFFDVAKETRRSLGESGIAFGVEQEGAIKVLHSRLIADPPAIITRPARSRQVNWFYSLAPKSFSFGSGTSSWIMEYHPGFLADWNPQPNATNSGIARQQALSRYVEVLKERPRQPIFQDVLSITLAVNPVVMMSLEAMCDSFNYQLQTEGEGKVYQGPDFVFRLIPETASQKGIQQITLRVSRTPETREFHFGKKSVLKFNNDRTAIWTF